MAAGKVSFNKGDYCRISYDEQLYECQVLDLDLEKSKTKVQLIGHNVILEVDQKSILPSLGKSTRVKQEEDAKICKALKAGDLCRAIRDGKFAEAKIWQLAEDDQKKTYAVIAFVDVPEAEITVWIESLRPAWKVDDYCRVQWSEDQVIYESQIKSIDSADGQRFAIVEFLGYGNQDSAWINEIMETMGDKPRQLQIAQGQGTLPQVEPEETPVWKDRDACRVVIGSDNAEYEGTIKALNEDGSATVHLIGMGKDVRQMMSELKPSAGKDVRAKQRVKATSEEQLANGIDNSKEPIIKVPTWEVGAFCRGVFKEDGLEYEGVIKSIEPSGDSQYTIVQFIGYGNEESIWVQDLLQSGGEEARQKQTKEALGEEVVVNGHNDTTVATDETDAGPIKTNIDKAWQPGMFCRGIYKEDGLEYEGLIKSVESTDDGQYAVVEFVGYGNQETLWVQELLKSAGDMARQKQTKEALGEVVDANEPEAIVDEVKAAPAEIKDSTLDESLASSGSSAVTVIAKEPWHPGMFCLSIYKEDGEAYEGLVKSIEGSEADGGQYAVVQFLGYGNEDTVWLQDLRQSKGEAARRQQTEQAEVVEVEDVVDGPASSLVATEPIDQNGNIAKEPSTETDKKVDANKDTPKEWHIGDFCRVLCEFDGQEHEVEILKQHPSNPELFRVQVLGYEHKEVKNRSLLKASLGETARKVQIEEFAAKSASTTSTTAGVKNTTITPPIRNESVVSVIKKLQDTNNNSQPKAVNGGVKEYSPLKEAPKAPKLSEANEDMNNNYQTVKVVDLPNASGDTMDWKKQFEMKSAQLDEVSKVNWYLMTTLNKMEMEMQGHVNVIQELKSSIKACLSNCPSAQSGKGLVNGY